MGASSEMSGAPAPGTGQAGLREAAGAETADGWRGVSPGLHGEEREPGTDQLLPGADLQVQGAGAGAGSCLLRLLAPSCKLSACGEPRLLGAEGAQPGPAAGIRVALAPTTAGSRLRLLLPCLQGVPGPRGGGRGPRRCGCAGRRQGEVVGAMVPPARSLGRAGAVTSCRTG